ncbi:MAG: PAS domain-containing sensor histidine kinase [Pseudomonadota bacterium]|nr:PAS domain-containing sensor histidine kinase [Pseudomonadota bacterium]
MDHPAASDLLYEGAACGLIVTAADGTILRANRTFCSWIGYLAEQLAGRRVDTLLTIGGRIFHQTHWAPLLKMQRSLSEVMLEMRHADGHRIPMVMNAVVHQHGGVEFHELAIFSARDRHQYEEELLKARERAEAHLRSEQASQKALAEARAHLELAMDAAQLFQWSVDLPSRLRRYESSVARLLGHREALPIDESDFLGHILPEDRAAEAKALEDFLDTPTGRYHTVFRMRNVEGQELFVAAWGRFRSDGNGSPAHFSGLLQDVSQSHRQRALAEDRALLAEQTLGIVGHDLRNPLAAIQMAAELLGLRQLDAAQQTALGERIRSSTRRANRLIADLLDFTRARTGRSLSVNKVLVDMHAIARDVVSEISSAHPTRTLVHHEQGDGRLVADGDRLSQALGNLVSNALTYGLADTKVTVRSEGLEDGVRLSVHNLGAVIDPAMRPTIFEPMTRGEAPGHLRSVGLGLYIVREIALAHGGTVDYVSSEAEGTTFVINLPR